MDYPSKALHRSHRNKLATEFLEQRHLLTAVMSLTPPVSGASSELPVISVTFDTDIDTNSVSTESLFVHGSQSGLHPHTAEVAGHELAISMSSHFLPGETVQVSITTQVASIDGEPLERAYVGQFRARAKNGTGVFADAGSAITWDTRSIDPVNWLSLSVDANLADLDGDGDLDVFLADRANSGEPNRVWMNDGSGRFTDSQQELARFASAAVTLGDVDSDGDLDAFVGNECCHPLARNPPPPADRVWLNDGNGMFVDSGQFLGEASTWDVALGDLDGDGDLDAISATEYSGNVVWLNNGSGHFSSGEVFGIDDTITRSWITLELGDIDLDGDLDAVVTNDKTGVEIFLNDGSGHFRAGGHFGTSGNEGLALGDLDNDGDLDVLLKSRETAAQVWLNDGQGNFLDSKQDLGTARGGAVSLGDIDGDGDLDAFVLNRALRTDDGWTGTNEIWLNDGLGNLAHSGESGAELGDSGFSYALVIGDLDGDGDLDALVDNRDELKVLLNQDQSAAAGDFDGDGSISSEDIDLLFAAIRESKVDPKFDLDGSHSVDDLDVAYLTENLLGTVRGDVDLDGQVTFADFLVISANFETGNSSTRSDGDLDGDQVVGFSDFLLLAADFGKDSTIQDSPVPLDLIPGSEGASPSQLTSAGDDLYFTTSEGLWRTDGSIENTVLLSEARANDLTAVDETLYFTVYVSQTPRPADPFEPRLTTRELWMTGGTGGTERVKEFTEFSNPACNFDACRGPRRTASLDGKLYFTNFGQGEFKSDVWVSDGTEEGTTILDGVSNLLVVDGTALFTTSNQLWRNPSDTAERVSVPDHLSLSGTEYVGDTLYFVQTPELFERVLWKTDFTQSGTVQVADIGAIEDSDSPIELTGVDETLYFAREGGTQLWKSDGTELGTILVKDFETQRLLDLNNVNGVLYFWTGFQERSLWTSDGTDAGTVQLQEFQSTPRNLTAANGTLYFSLYNADAGTSELWTSDGTVGGAAPVTTDARNPNQLHLHQDRLFFVAENPNVGRELWSMAVADAHL